MRGGSKNVTMNVRLLPSIVECIKVLATNEGKAYSQWVRDAIEEKLQKEKDTLYKILYGGKQ